MSWLKWLFILGAKNVSVQFSSLKHWKENAFFAADNESLWEYVNCISIW